MSRSLHRSFKDYMILLSLVLALVFLGMNVILYLLNQSYLERKIEAENQAFLELTTMLIDESDLTVALAYIEHYTHIHDVEIEINDADGVMLYASALSYRYTKEYQIDTTMGRYTIFIDNTTSVTALTVRDNFLYVNLTLFVIYALAVSALYLVSRRQGRRIETDLQAVLRLTSEHQARSNHWSFEEFRLIHEEVQNALETIDRLYEQKERHRMSLAHDIKTPLTVLYAHLAKDDPAKRDASAALAAARSINQLVEDLLRETSDTSLHPIDLTDVIHQTVQRYQTVFATKGMAIVTDLDPVLLDWNTTDGTRVLENLLGNAYEYSQTDSTVHIALREGKTIEWTVTSTPTDIDTLEPARFFDKGYTTSNQDGKGLGLYITKLLIQPLGGTITATIDKDALRFTIRLPS